MRKFVIVILGAVSIAGVWTETSSARKFMASKANIQGFCDREGGNFSSSPGAGYGCAVEGYYVACTESGVCKDRTQVPPTKYGSGAGQAPATTLGNGGRTPTAGNASGASGTLTAGSTSTSKSTTKTAPVTTVTATVGAGGGMPPSGRPPLRQQ